MPTSPPRQCPRCRQRVATGRACSCATRNGSTWRSRRRRAAVLRDQPICGRTGTEWWWPGPATSCPQLSTEEDHITALADGGSPDGPTWGLCRDCHQVKTNAERARRG